MKNMLLNKSNKVNKVDNLPILVQIVEVPLLRILWSFLAYILPVVSTSYKSWWVINSTQTFFCLRVLPIWRRTNSNNPIVPSPTSTKSSVSPRKHRQWRGISPMRFFPSSLSYRLLQRTISTFNRLLEFRNRRQKLQIPSTPLRFQDIWCSRQRTNHQRTYFKSSERSQCVSEIDDQIGVGGKSGGSGYVG